ncbi:SUMF1/EgtB/PvdO family nonheme iron enzyme [Dickeya dianthicola]|uniref:SUMF1/EgtB/PvdO family nonheme iron enzyme n=1 Tax=Dickeya dianthicola TaxID=204039 RepID=UPI001868ABF3|nr:SUMF1/EgtB/PvdO family nonheme iron enzyme [Dickeya dianthicola]QOL16278.1 formylglycine-generating enzyme family protein [Dickeya dianthicola]
MKLNVVIYAALLLSQATHAAPPKTILDEISIKGGSFYVGNIFGDKEYASHTNVTLAPFYMMRTEMTSSQYQQVLQWAETHGYTFENGCNGGHFDDCLPTEQDNGEHPVTTISWWDAVVFANALSALRQLTPYYLSASGKPITSVPQEYTLSVVRNPAATGYRLPSLNEWQVAARGGEVGLHQGTYGRIYSGSDNPERIANMPKDNSTTFSTQPVGRLQPNALGLYDMTGNVWEWIDDDFQMTGLNNMHYFCGGSYLMRISNLSECDVHTPNFPTSDIGFRLVRPAPH